ncbi:hypothetical protein Hypma_008746 [Hypsizygus marmoreus]|uniref:Uncharacterized protein n=1 Tax=Hypsizygus marmoreus TaxID=39966 RepID=A0A369JP83_HYPMA|nr:hypothetical protein Hypma_008746 [Hypsizygus marmoreus]
MSANTISENGQHTLPDFQERLATIRTRSRISYTPVLTTPSLTTNTQQPQHPDTVMSDTTNLFSLARSKLHVSVGGKDSCSLHRWVLLKNSIIRSPSVPSSPSASDYPDVNSEYAVDDEADEEEEVNSEELDSFMFPDAGKLVGGSTADVTASEAEWLDSLLETLGDDDDDEFTVESDPSLSILPVDEDDDQLLLSPMGSPISSSDDLPPLSAFYPHSTTVSYSYPYPVPYPPFHPPLIHSYEFDSDFDPSLSSLPAPYDDPLPYHDLSDSENLSVPDAIEDTSDDESDAPPTPSMGRSTTSLTLLDAASIPLPSERSSLRHTNPHVHVESDDSYFYPFELDPLPFPEDHHTYNTYQEC